MQFQERDGQILLAIYKYGGVLARRHLKRMFWPHATLRAMQKRLAKLVNDGYIARPSAHQRRTQPVPEPIYWLDWKGILWVAAQLGVAVEPPANTGENQKRKLKKRLHDGGISWLREPRWIQLQHDLDIVDVHLAIESAVSELPTFRLEEWRHESEFRSHGDTITYKVYSRDGIAKQCKKRVYPDSYFVIAGQPSGIQGSPRQHRFLLELDRATHSGKRFREEKIFPGVAYIKNPKYKARFGDNSGCWLVVTTGKVRRRNLMKQAKQVAEAEDLFLFTTFHEFRIGNVLTKPIWWQVGREKPMALLEKG